MGKTNNNAAVLISGIFIHRRGHKHKHKQLIHTLTQRAQREHAQKNSSSSSRLRE